MYHPRGESTAQRGLKSNFLGSEWPVGKTRESPEVFDSDSPVATGEEQI